MKGQDLYQKYVVAHGFEREALFVLLRAASWPGIAETRPVFISAKREAMPRIGEADRATGTLGFRTRQKSDSCCRLGQPLLVGPVRQHGGKPQNLANHRAEASVSAGRQHEMIDGYRHAARHGGLRS